MSTVPMEIHTDVIGEKLYASRNYNQLRHVYQSGTANRTQVDWGLTLRQVRAPKSKLKSSASAPTLHTAELQESRTKREPLAPEHPEGPYLGESQSLGKYQNFANSAHMCNGLVRVSSGAAPKLDWQLNLRNGLHQNEFKTKWRRHYARPHQSFDYLAENCSKQNDKFQNSQVTPQDLRYDRRYGAISIESIRDDPISFRRWPGCEGTQASYWRHLIEDTSRGRKVRRHIEYEVTLREDPKDPNGARIHDTRNHGCVVEMLGKKKWVAHQHHDPLVARWPTGDPKLYHLSQQRILPEPDEENRELRKHKQPRTDVNIPESRSPLRRRDHDHDSTAF